MATLKFKSDDHSFQKDCRLLREKFFKEKGVNYTGNWKLYSKSLIIGFGFILLYSLIVFTSISIWIKVLLLIPFGINVAMIGFNIMHDGGHDSFSSQRWVNIITANSLNILGGSAHIWNVKHNQVHHTNTNVHGHDNDIDNTIIRVHPEQEYHWYHKFQHIYGPFAYSLSYLFWIYYQDIAKYSKGHVCGYPLRFSFWQHVIFWLSKFIHITIFILIPLIWYSGFQVFIGYLLFTMTTGLLISFVFQLAHVVPKANMVTAIDNKFVESNNKIHQVMTTCNFSTKSRFWTWICGGLNFQIEHHLYPEVSHIHYPSLQKEVKDLFKRHNLEYNEYDTIISAIWAHLATLWRFGRIRSTLPA